MLMHREDVTATHCRRRPLEVHEAIVKLLLEKGADVNAQGGRHGHALQAASFGGHEAIMKLLLEKGADVNAQGGRHCHALQAASFGGHEAIVKLLLEKGADVNAQGGWNANALQAASDEGHTEIVQLLLANGGLPSEPDHAEMGPDTSDTSGPEWVSLLSYSYLLHL